VVIVVGFPDIYGLFTVLGGALAGFCARKPRKARRIAMISPRMLNTITPFYLSIMYHNIGYFYVKNDFLP